MKRYVKEHYGNAIFIQPDGRVPTTFYLGHVSMIDVDGDVVYIRIEGVDKISWEGEKIIGPTREELEEKIEKIRKIMQKMKG